MPLSFLKLCISSDVCCASSACPSCCSTSYLLHFTEAGNVAPLFDSLTVCSVPCRTTSPSTGSPGEQQSTSPPPPGASHPSSSVPCPPPPPKSPPGEPAVCTSAPADSPFRIQWLDLVPHGGHVASGNPACMSVLQLLSLRHAADMSTSMLHIQLFVTLSRHTASDSAQKESGLRHFPLKVFAVHRARHHAPAYALSAAFSCTWARRQLLSCVCPDCRRAFPKPQSSKLLPFAATSSSQQQPSTSFSRL